MRILVIDDDVTMLWSLCSMLRRWGSEVEAATGAMAGVRMLSKGSFDIVLLDYRMPDHDALWFLRNTEIPPQTAVAVMTGFADPLMLSKLRSLGIGDVIEKPFSEADLLDRLQKLSVESTWRHKNQHKTGKETETRENVHAAHADDNRRPHFHSAAAPHAA
ncbi:MAG: response regulator [Lentisphaerae bacterium]|nr:response regulator [Lentisphaerota bacterium]